MSILRSLVLAVCFGLPAVQADTLITAREGTGQAGGSQTPGAEQGQSRQIWLRADRMASLDSDGRMIGRLDRGETYVLRDAKKSCFRVKHKKQDIDTSAQRKSVFQKTGETKQVGPWETVGYEATIPLNESATYKLSIWVSDEVTLGLEDYQTNTRGTATPATYWLVDSLSLGGYPVLQETQIGTMTSWMQITSVKAAKPPAGIYEIPAGYTGCN